MVILFEFSKFSYLSALILSILDSIGIVDISDTGVQSSINEFEETLKKEEAKQVFAADILESSFADVSKGNEHFQYLSKINHYLSKINHKSAIITPTDFLLNTMLYY